MAKRHTTQSHKQSKGQFFTTRANTILQGWEDIVKDKQVIDPFAGDYDLLKWSQYAGSASTHGYDIEPRASAIYNDSLINPVDLTGKVIVTNPPYLSRNKSKGKYSNVFERWSQSDLYKCFLASLYQSNCTTGIVIIPSNFFCESRPAARKTFFKHYSIISAKYWSIPIFEDATTGITAFAFKQGGGTQHFPMTFYPQNITEKVTLEQHYNYLWGQEFFDILPNAHANMHKTDVGMPAPNTNLVLGLLDKGKWKQGLTYNDDEPIYCQPKAFTTYQLTIPEYTLSVKRQQHIVHEFNTTLQTYRKKYHGMFLGNYMGATQKILSRTLCHKLITRYITQQSDLIEF